MIAYISLSLVGISTTVSVFTVKALPVALRLSLLFNETVALCRNVDLVKNKAHTQSDFFFPEKSSQTYLDFVQNY